MNSAVELHDSTVSGVAQIGRQVMVCFLPAYVHRSEGQPGMDSGSGWLQAAILSWVDAEIVVHHFADPNTVWSGPDAAGLFEFPDYISTGDLSVGSRVSENFIPIPLPESGQLELRISLAQSGLVVSISGKGALLSMVGEPVYVEEFPGAETP